MPSIWSEINAQSNAEETSKKLEKAEERSESLLNQVETLQNESEKNLKSKIEMEAALANVQSETKERIAELKDLIAAKVGENRDVHWKRALVDSEEMAKWVNYTGYWK